MGPRCRSATFYRSRISGMSSTDRHVASATRPPRREHPTHLANRWCATWPTTWRSSTIIGSTRDEDRVRPPQGRDAGLPPGHPGIPQTYRTIGQPVLIPGSMGTASWILVGQAGSMDQMFGTTCHGAGRLMSRMAAVKEAHGRQRPKVPTSTDVLLHVVAKGVGCGRANAAQRMCMSFAISPCIPLREGAKRYVMDQVSVVAPSRRFSQGFDTETDMGTADRGFASMDPTKQREIASKGGKAAHLKGTAHEWTREEARDAGRKGGRVAHRRPERSTQH